MMSSKKSIVTAAFRDPNDAVAAYDRVRNLGYSDSEIDLMVSDQVRSQYFADEDHDRGSRKGSEAGSLMEEGAGVGGAIGTVTGAVIGAILTAGSTLVFPALSLVIAGPIAGALAGAGAGGATGGLIGALVGYGYPETDAKVYEEVLHNGGAVIGVHPRSSKDASRLEDELKACAGEQVSTCSVKNG